MMNSSPPLQLHRLNDACFVHRYAASYIHRTDKSDAERHATVSSGTRYQRSGTIRPRPIIRRGAPVVPSAVSSMRTRRRHRHAVHHHQMSGSSSSSGASCTVMPSTSAGGVVSTADGVSAAVETFSSPVACEAAYARLRTLIAALTGSGSETNAASGIMSLSTPSVASAVILEASATERGSRRVRVSFTWPSADVASILRVSSSTFTWTLSGLRPEAYTSKPMSSSERRTSRDGVAGRAARAKEDSSWNISSKSWKKASANLADCMARSRRTNALHSACSSLARSLRR
mmetsp:Transcript_1538/g.3843  ORF Transcript_1538/g.3843 Transcript_1538/m.3843 type:complete len:288 (+) Transcript_1538:83-946(+)